MSNRLAPADHDLLVSLLETLKNMQDSFKNIQEDLKEIKEQPSSQHKDPLRLSPSLGTRPDTLLQNASRPESVATVQGLLARNPAVEAPFPQVQESRHGVSTERLIHKVTNGLESQSKQILFAFNLLLLFTILAVILALALGILTVWRGMVGLLPL